jgi:capsular polysaccharide biosynthesis protein
VSEQALDLRRSLTIVRRHWIIVVVLAIIGMLAGAGYALRTPPMLSSQAWVLLPPSTHDVSTQVVVAGSDPVLAKALPNVSPPTTLTDLNKHVQVKSLTANIIAISAQGKTSDQAEDTANAVADAYIAYITSTKSAAGKVQVHLLQPASQATGTSPTTYLIVVGLVGALAGAVLGSIAALALFRGDRRLRERDQIADSIGVPVLASVPVRHPSSAANWTKLLDDYEPSIVHAWRLRTTLHYLGLADLTSADGPVSGQSLTVLSLSSDKHALALGPQLAVYAASLGIPTALVIGPQHDSSATATLRTACAAPPQSSSRPGQLRVIVVDREDVQWRPDAKLTIVVTVVDGKSPRVAETIRTTTSVVGVSAGSVTAAQLASVAASAASDGRQIDGILVADPDPADHTTGRIPQLARPAYRSPTRLPGTTSHIRNGSASTRHGRSGAGGRPA